MVGRNVFCWGLITVAVIGSRIAVADSISFTGNVASDFGISASGQSSMAGVSVITTPTNLNPISSTGTGGTALLNYVSPGDSIKEVALQYNSATDTMSVGIQTWGVAGSVPGSTIASGNGMVVGFEPLAGTYNPATLTAPTFVAGSANVSAGQSNAGRGPGLDGFNVATYTGGTVPGTMNLLTGFGTTIAAGMGKLAFDPSTSTPGYEFTITNFSKLLGANPNNGVVVMTQDGEINVATSKDELVGYMPAQQQAQEIPEPTSLLVWAGLAGGMAWGYRRRSRRLAS